MQLTLGPWHTQQAAAQQVRVAVFVHEQGVPRELEWDEFDAQSLHAVVLDDRGTALATGRLLPDSHIGRMAVMPQARSQGIGSQVLQALIDAARQRGDARVLLHAQIHASAFYARHGFVAVGAHFMEAGIEHVVMERGLA